MSYSIHLDTAANLNEDGDASDIVLLINGKFECSWGSHFMHINQMRKEQTMIKKHVMCVLEAVYEKGLKDGKANLQNMLKELLDIEI